jgi:uncharacterized delta-60 repeat protein
MFRFPVFRVTLSQCRKVRVVVFACTLLGLVAARAQTPGSLDALNVAVGIGEAGEAMGVVATQPDGKILIAGNFRSVNSIVRQRIARLNTDGTVDSSFNPWFDGQIFSLAVQKDEKILIAGQFITFYPNGNTATPTTRWNIARLNPDGSLDASFNPRANNLVSGLLVQPDGKIVISGAFSGLQPNGAAVSTARNKIARIHANGTLDTGFDPKPNGDVAGIALQPDGSSADFSSAFNPTAPPPRPPAGVSRGYMPMAHSTLASIRILAVTK